MINSPFFPEGILPHLPISRYYPADVSDFSELASAAQDIIIECYGGYMLVGGRHSIGVFVWGTSSIIDQRVGPSVNGIGVNGTVEVSRNGTRVGEEFLMAPGESGALVETS